jgi:hypothetical protein
MPGVSVTLARTKEYPPKNSTFCACEGAANKSAAKRKVQTDAGMRMDVPSVIFD